MDHRTRTVILCIDAADFEMIEYFISKGVLKNFERIVKNGVFGPLQSTIPPFTAPAWTSFFTGVYPEKHGMYDFVKREKNNYDVTHGHTVTPHVLGDVRVPALWDFLEGKLCIINVPMTFPAPHTNGIFISGFPFSGDKYHAFWPPDLSDMITRTFGEYPFHDEIHISQHEPATESLFNKLIQIMEKRKDIYVHFLKTGDFDFYILQFQNLDKIQHKFWCFWDHRYIGFERDDTLCDAIERAYKKVDDIVGDIVACLGDGVLFIISDHGFGLIDMVPALNNWLSRNGFLQSRAPESFMGKYKHGLLTVFKKLRLNAVFGMVPCMLKRFKKTLRSTRMSAEDIEWSQTAASSVGYPLYIYLNKEFLKNAERKTRDEIVRKLSRDLKDESIFSKEELYTVDDAASPDIIVKLKEYPLGVPARNLIAASGHREKGIFIAYGPAIKKGCTIDAHIVDIAPTVLHMVNMPVPSYTDGKVLHIFEEGSEPAKREVTYDYTDREKIRIRKQVQALKEDGAL